MPSIALHHIIGQYTFKLSLKMCGKNLELISEKCAQNCTHDWRAVIDTLANFKDLSAGLREDWVQSFSFSVALSLKDLNSAVLR